MSEPSCKSAVLRPAIRRVIAGALALLLAVAGATGVSAQGTPPPAAGATA